MAGAFAVTRFGDGEKVMDYLFTDSLFVIRIFLLFFPTLVSCDEGRNQSVCAYSTHRLFC